MAATAIQTTQAGSLATLDAATMHQLVTGGDCSHLSPAQKTAYYVARCEAAGLDPRAQPFAFVRLSGREVLYAQKAASDQLAAKHGVRMTIVSQTTEDGIRVVTVRAEAKDGRATEEIGALPVKGLQGEALSNALMKCVTKAKRRAVLSLCGLGMLDETEVDSIPSAHVAPPAESARAPVVEVLPPAKPQAPATPAHALALWNRLVDTQGGNKRLAKGLWDQAAKDAEVPALSSDWTEAETAKVAEFLFPTDIKF